MELAGAQQGRSADQPRDGFARGRHRLRERDRQGRRDPASAGLLDRHREHLAHGRVAVGEHVALARRAALERRQMSRGDVVHVDEASFPPAERQAGDGGSRRGSPGRAPFPATGPGRRRPTDWRSPARSRPSPGPAPAPRLAASSARRRCPSGSRRRPAPTRCRLSRRGRRRRWRCGPARLAPASRAAATTLRAPSAFTRSKMPGSANHCSNSPMQLKTPSTPSTASRIEPGSVTSPRSELDARRKHLAGPGRIADQRHDLVATIGQPPGDRVADLAGGARDQEPHRRASLPG